MLILKDCLLNGLFINQHLAASKGCREEPSMSVTTSGAATNMMTVFYYIFLKKNVLLQLKITLQLKKCDDFKYLHSATQWPVFD